MTQEERILDYMQENGGITQLDATYELGITRLAARISDLRAHGVQVYGQTVRVKNRYGENTHVTSYSLEKEEVEA